MNQKISTFGPHLCRNQNEHERKSAVEMRIRTIKVDNRLIEAINIKNIEKDQNRFRTRRVCVRVIEERGGRIHENK